MQLKRQTTFPHESIHVFSSALQLLTAQPFPKADVPASRVCEENIADGLLTPSSPGQLQHLTLIVS